MSLIISFWGKGHCQSCWHVPVLSVLFCCLIYYHVSSTQRFPGHALLLCRFSFFNLFSGFMIPFVSMGWWWRWFTYINPVSWSLYALLASQLGNVQATITDFNGSTITVGEFMVERFGFKYSMVGPIVAILFGYVLFFRAVSVYALARINYQKR